MSKKIGFIGQGWIGKNYADDFENRGHDVVRFSLEEPYIQNKELIRDCRIVFVAVPTPSTPKGFDDSFIRKSIQIAGDDATVVIKSTVLPGTTESIQRENPRFFVLHAPEFLSEATAAHDAANPIRNIIGIPLETDEYISRAQEVLDCLPKAPYEKICRAKEAEFIKYGGNNWFYFKVIFFNMLYDLTRAHDLEWDIIKEAMAADPRIGSTHMNPVHNSGQPGGHVAQTLKFNDLHMEPIHKSGRGAGGHCFIKDFAAFHEMYERDVANEYGLRVLEALRDKNIHLLVRSEKDLDLLMGVYGEDMINKYRDN
ncbi:hypothetical protein A2331_03060 [Candidatus Falkowbacteria bacterium RIFOXYB2_FULL_34_18]|uniref:Uncharacterized protein n=1 Tax=Candidatus Falkowbacteria bacterium RIFOXYD2_FULL_34_120 TaxID=1798007 RepID=A0A1F5TMM4_9BACT|nr:MAG: hypothetical protein A2331_03060 [Candidatus Falkowbacteria bacterium RIFOXYB2_FULL_34_18]OGF28312.1 MAG: hypothetical protein A2500_02880 [Candidatus Falkowbacteria bacterium RIFOXYC12_FULL_34_55]OGF37969.1 MAG: hypothetical protein A2466_06205 [Candidatus Falkowbacteria bacterium RIFOXYC2_FULL_34_220]OGF39687.1 MAG: hypothetical protein A2515_07500 [Candidatus Falkowbacteria bacterium RIFOXYD12_FULL_34_57]OGF40126.1 MAG: hypothetical protein A2531_05195 [Candidatus Falkowbacteria bact